MSDDHQFLDKLHREMEQDRVRIAEEHDRQRQVLTSAWEKDHIMKVALKESKKKMTEHVKTILVKSPLKQGAFTQLSQVPRQDFSVGFDIRSQSGK